MASSLLFAATMSGHYSNLEFEDLARFMRDIMHVDGRSDCEPPRDTLHALDAMREAPPPSVPPQLRQSLPADAGRYSIVSPRRRYVT